MREVLFKFDKEKDLWNHWHKANWKSNWSKFKSSEDIKKICGGKTFEESKKNLSNYLFKLHNSNLIDLEINCLKNSWKKIEKEFFDRMDKLMKKKFNKKIIAYLTTAGICPYNPKEPSFMFSFFYSLPQQLQTCGHEIMHLYFHEFYWDEIESKIGEEKTSNLKEALTVLLNLEFKDLWFKKDSGYKSHEELRKFISKKWKKNKDFDLLIKACIKDYFHL
jgi:hypothetical protein